MSKFRKWLIYKLGGYTESYIRVSKEGIEIIIGDEAKLKAMPLSKEENKK